MADNTRQPTDARQPNELARIAAFEEAHARAQATEVGATAWGFGLLQSDFPQSYDHNRIVVTSAVSVDEIIATADDVLGQAGLQHRYVTVVDDGRGVSMVPAFEAAGFTHEPIATMVYRRTAPSPPEHEVTDMAVHELRDAIIRDWRHDMPDADEAVFEQLADRTALYSRGCDDHRLAITAAGEVAARANLFLDRSRSIAQFENLYTNIGHRGHGYARSLVHEALRRAAGAGCDLCFLTADVDDWPYAWYERLGFVEATRTHHFTRSPQ